MKSDGDAMETTEATEAVPEPSSPQEATLEQAPSQPEPADDAAPGTNLKANGKPLAVDPKTKPKVDLKKPVAKSTGASASNSRPGAASQRSVNDVKSLNNVSAKKSTTAAKSSSAAGAVPKRPMGVATVSAAVKSQTKVPEKKPVGQSRTAALPASPIANGTKLAAVNGSAKTRPGSETVRAKTAAPSRSAASAAPKPSSSAVSKAGVPASAKTSKPVAGPPKSRPASATSRPTTATSKPPTAATTKTTTVRATPAPSAGKTAAAQPLKTAPAKKDVGRPLSAAAAKKPAGAAAAAAAAATATTRKPGTSKPTALSKINSASKLSTTPKASDPKVSQPQSQPVNSAPKKKPAATVRFPANNKPPLGRTPPASPVSKSENRTTQSKGGLKPTQAVLPLTVTKQAGAKTATRPAEHTQSVSGVPAATGPAATVPASSLIGSVPDPAVPEANVPAEIVTEAPPSVPQEPSLTASEPDPVVPAASVLPEAPESSSHESSPTAPVPEPVSPETNVPAEIVREAPESIPGDPSLAAPVPDSLSPEESTPAEIVREAPGPVPDDSSPTASVQDTVSPEVHVPAEMATEAPQPLPHEPSLTAAVPEEAPLPAPVLTTQLIPEETWHTQASDPSAPQGSVETALSQPSELWSSGALLEHLEGDASLMEQEQPPAAGPTSPPMESPPDFSEEPVLTEQSPSTSEAQEMAANTVPHKVPHSSLNEEEDEEEREGSQLISVSEMSGTTQPTEDSRPGSAGPVGGSAWRAGGALLSELDSEEVSGSQQGASELSAPGVLEGTESMDDLGDGSLKGAVDTEGASAGSPDFEKVPDIPANDFEEDEDDEDDRVCDMDVSSERADEPQRPRHDNDVEDDEEDDEDEDEDVEMASEGITESGLESYGNADEDDFVDDERLDNLNRVGQHPPPPPLLPSAPAAQWEQPNPLAHPWSEGPQQVQEADRAAGSPLADPWPADSETPTQTPAQAWLELGLGSLAPENQDHFAAGDQAHSLEARLLMGESSGGPEALSAPRVSLSGTLSSQSSTPEEQPQGFQAVVFSSNSELNYQDLVAQMEKRDGEEDEEAETLPADEVLGGPATAPASNPSSSSSASEDEPSDTEGEAHLDDSLDRPIVSHAALDKQPASQRCLSTVEEGEEADMECAVEDTTPPSATSLASYGFDTVTTASNSNALSTGESCIKSPGIFSLEELPDEPRKPSDGPQPHLEPCLSEQQYIDCGKQDDGSADHAAEEEPGPKETPGPPSTPGIFQLPEENPDDIQPPYYSAICEKTENSFAGFTALPHPHRPDHAACPRNYCDIVRPCGATDHSPKPAFTDLPARSAGQQAPSTQLCRLEQHQKELLKLRQSCPLEEAEQERKRKEKEEAAQEIKENKEEMLQMREEEEMKERRDLELQLQQQQEELKQRQQIMQWQQELQQANKGQAVLLSPSSGLCTIYEALENSDEDEGDGGRNINKKEPRQKIPDRRESLTSVGDKSHEQSPFSPTPPLPDAPETPNNPSRDGHGPPSGSPATPEQPSPLDLDWGKKVDIVQQLINQTLLLNREGCSSLLLLPGGAGGTLSPLESSLWPSLLPPLTPPSATVTSVSSFSPETTGSSPQEEWTVVELETHH